MTVTPDWKPAQRVVADRKAWDRIVLEKAGPCRSCGVVATEFHHLVPRGQRGDDVAGNLIAICRSCHRVLTDRLQGWKVVAAAIRESLSPLEERYIVAKKGRTWIDRMYPRGEAQLCARCRKPRAPAVETEAPRPRKSWTVSVPVDHRENGYMILTELVEQARVKIGRPEHTPPYFTLVEALAIFVRDAQRGAS